MTAAGYGQGWAMFLGDARELLAETDEGAAAAIITDPVWPNPSPKIIGHERPFELFAEVAHDLARIPKRLVIHMGCNSDPRILAPISMVMPFLRVCWLEYAIPHPAARVLAGSDVAYAFGDPIKSGERGRHLIPGRSPKSQPGQHFAEHPCSRSLTFARWLAFWFSDRGETILDPFAGAGTTGVAALSLGRRFIGFELDPQHFDYACRNLEEASRSPQLFDLIDEPDDSLTENVRVSAL